MKESRKALFFCNFLLAKRYTSGKPHIMKHVLPSSCILLLICLSISASAQWAPAWVSYSVAPGGPYFGCSNIAMKVDSAGNIYLFNGINDTLGTDDYCEVVKMNNTGTVLWTDTIHIQTQPTLAMLLGRDNCIYICRANAYPSNSVRIVKYSSSGNRMHDNYISSNMTVMFDLTIDDSCNIYMTGQDWLSDGAVTCKCDSAGNLVYNVIYDYNPNMIDRALGIAVDVWGNAYVSSLSTTSSGNSPSHLVKYSPSGQLIWQQHFSSYLFSSGGLVRLYQDTIVYVVGASSTQAGSGDYEVLQADSSGVVNWSHRFNGDSVINYSYNRPDSPVDAVVTRNGKLCITGKAPDNGQPQWMNIAYTPQGILEWTVIDDPTDGHVTDQLITPDQQVVQAAYIWDPNQNKYLVKISSYDTTGLQLWNYITTPIPTASHINPVLGCDSLSNIYCAFTILDSINGSSAATMRLANTLSIHSYTETSFSVWPNPSTGLVMVTSTANPKLEVIDLTGRIVMTTNMQTERASLDLSTLPNGVYTLKALATGSIETVKVVLQR